MIHAAVVVIAALTGVDALSAADAQPQVYFPGPWGDWETRPAERVGMNSARLDEALDFAQQNENTMPKDLRTAIALSFANEPFNTIIGPTKIRGDGSGIVIRHGYIVAEWGDTRRVDMTFSVTKSYLSTVAGLAFDQNRIRRVKDPVRLYVRNGMFEGEHNSKITWEHLLNQTSDWSGTLWDKPDWADRPGGSDPKEWPDRELKDPGSSMKYNDVRVNLLSYCLLNVWRKPLPVVLRERVMEKIDCSPTWRWHGYENSWVTIDGQKMQSVSGGGHWGGGLFICARDHARFGYLFLRGGRWRDEQLISDKWIKMMTVPTPAEPAYGYMWWLNTDRRRLPSAPESAFYASGFGGNFIYIDKENDLVIVLRWVPNLEGVVQHVLAAIE